MKKQKERYMEVNSGLVKTFDEWIASCQPENLDTDPYSQVYNLIARNQLIEVVKDSKGKWVAI